MELDEELAERDYYDDGDLKLADRRTNLEIMALASGGYDGAAGLLVQNGIYDDVAEAMQDFNNLKICPPPLDEEDYIYLENLMDLDGNQVTKSENHGNYGDFVNSVPYFEQLKQEQLKLCEEALRKPGSKDTWYTQFGGHNKVFQDSTSELGCDSNYVLFTIEDGHVKFTSEDDKEVFMEFHTLLVCPWRYKSRAEREIIVDDGAYDDAEYNVQRFRARHEHVPIENTFAWQEFCLLQRSRRYDEDWIYLDARTGPGFTPNKVDFFSRMVAGHFSNCHDIQRLQRDGRGMVDTDLGSFADSLYEQNRAHNHDSRCPHARFHDCDVNKLNLSTNTNFGTDLFACCQSRIAAVSGPEKAKVYGGANPYTPLLKESSLYFTRSGIKYSALWPILALILLCIFVDGVEAKHLPPRCPTSRACKAPTLSPSSEPVYQAGMDLLRNWNESATHAYSGAVNATLHVANTTIRVLLNGAAERYCMFGECHTYLEWVIPDERTMCLMFKVLMFTFHLVCFTALFLRAIEAIWKYCDIVLDTFWWMVKLFIVTLARFKESTMLGFIDLDDFSPKVPKFQAEGRIPGSDYNLTTGPGCQVYLALGDEIVGSGWRFGDHLITADHVYSDIYASNKPLVLYAYKFAGNTWSHEQVDVPEPDIYVGRSDMVAVPIPKGIWAGLRVRSARCGTARIGTAISVFGYSDDKNLFSVRQKPIGAIGAITKRLSLGKFLHSSSTAKGFSGAPIMGPGGVVVGMHLGYDSTSGANVGVVTSFLSPFHKESEESDDDVVHPTEADALPDTGNVDVIDIIDKINGNRALAIVGNLYNEQTYETDVERDEKMAKYEKRKDAEAAAEYANTSNKPSYFRNMTAQQKRNAELAEARAKDRAAASGGRSWGDIPYDEESFRALLFKFLAQTQTPEIPVESSEEEKTPDFQVSPLSKDQPISSSSLQSTASESNSLQTLQLLVPPLSLEVGLEKTVEITNTPNSPHNSSQASSNMSGPNEVQKLKSDLSSIRDTTSNLSKSQKNLQEAVGKILSILSAPNTQPPVSLQVSNETSSSQMKDSMKSSGVASGSVQPQAVHGSSSVKQNNKPGKGGGKKSSKQ